MTCSLRDSFALESSTAAYDASIFVSSAVETEFLLQASVIDPEELVIKMTKLTIMFCNGKLPVCLEPFPIFDGGE
jgi:hypothetical protein